MPMAIPFIPSIVGGATSIIGGLLGKKKKAAAPGGAPAGAPGGGAFAPNQAYTQPLSQFGGAVLPMAQQGFKSAFDYHSGVLADPTTATASDAASVGRQTQQLTDRASRTMPRGGASASLVGQLPQQQMSAGLERRIGAQQTSANSIGQLAGQAGGLGTNVFGGLLGNELGAKQVNTGAGYLDLANKEADRDWYGKIGGGIFDILSGGNPIGSDSPLGKLGGLLGNLGKKKPGTGYSGIGDIQHGG